MLLVRNTVTSIANFSRKEHETNGYIIW